MSVHTNTPDMVRWTCQATDGTSQAGTATDDYGPTAFGKVSTHQHWWPWANGFLPRTENVKGNPPKTYVKGCDRDEWPPRAFWPVKSIADKKGLVQRVRFLPYKENSGAGHIWQGFCNDNGASSTHGKKTYIQSEHISTIGAASTDKSTAQNKKVVRKLEVLNPLSILPKLVSTTNTTRRHNFMGLN